MLGSRAKEFHLWSKKSLGIVLVLSVIALAASWYFLSPPKRLEVQTTSESNNRAGPPNAGAKGQQGRRNGFTNLPTAVTAVQAKLNALKSIKTSIGTVVPAAEVIVHSRVSGQLTRVFFEEGQWVTQGQLLAQIDPRTFEADVAQIQGQADRNKALLRNAEQDLARYLSLKTQSAISQQQIDSQRNLVEQYRGTVLADQGALERAKLQLSFTKVVAPIEGRIGLRNLDAGNNISPTDTDGLAVITQVQPVNVVFTLPEDSLPALLQSQAAAKTNRQVLAVEAWDKSNRQVLAKGQVLSLDNRIDPTTGTIKLKASFENKDSSLFPNQFVNLRVELAQHTQATTVPITAIQRGSQGTYVYVVQHSIDKPRRPTTENSTEGSPEISTDRTQKAPQSVSIRLVKLGESEINHVAILEGLQAGDWVVTQGVDKLRDGANVIASTESGNTINLGDKNTIDPAQETRRARPNGSQDSKKQSSKRQNHPEQKS